MKAPYSLPTALPLTMLLFACWVLAGGCAMHKSKPQAPTPATAPSAQPAVATPAHTNEEPRPRRPEQPIKAATAPANSAPAVSSPTITTPPRISAPTSTSKPAPTVAPPATPKPEAINVQPPKAALSKPGPAKTQAVPESNKPEPPRPEAATAAPATPAPVGEKLVVDLDKLPLSVQGQWTVDRDESRCTLQSAVQHIDDGQGGSKISLWLTAKELNFVTESDIDLSYTGTGITIDDGRHFDLENVDRRTNPAFSRQRAALLEAMKGGHTLQLTLGFWPSWPVTHTYSVSFPIQHFATAYTAWESCNTQLNQR